MRLKLKILIDILNYRAFMELYDCQPSQQEPKIKKGLSQKKKKKNCGCG